MIHRALGLDPDDHRCEAARVGVRHPWGSWFGPHARVHCISLLTCRPHQGLITQGEHLTNRCKGWTDDMIRQQG
ncbi:hypothetical protein [Synechococcus sp. GFB01]|uniref:hypothetical protein n=1 Tax=Synechococcus sp. GFB01 TaxID=1662190 RepID=UPI00069E331A|nr:hypothetical protein [Synechococcus sp. GFB01]